MGQWRGGILLLMAVNLTLPCVGHVQGGDRVSVDKHKDYCRCETLSEGWVHQVGIHGDMEPCLGSVHPIPTHRHWSPKPADLGVTFPASHKVSGGEVITSKVKKPFWR